MSTIGKNMFLIMIFTVSLLLSASATSCKERPAQRTGVTHNTGEAATVGARTAQTLSTFNEIVAVAVLIGGAIFGTYCLRISNKTIRGPARRRTSRALKKGKRAHT